MAFSPWNCSVNLSLPHADGTCAVWFCASNISTLSWKRAFYLLVCPWNTEVIEAQANYGMWELLELHNYRRNIPLLLWNWFYCLAHDLSCPTAGVCPSSVLCNPEATRWITVEHWLALNSSRDLPWFLRSVCHPQDVDWGQKWAVCRHPSMA